MVTKKAGAETKAGAGSETKAGAEAPQGPEHQAGAKQSPKKWPHPLLVLGTTGLIFGIFIVPLIEDYYASCPWIHGSSAASLSSSPHSANDATHDAIEEAPSRLFSRSELATFGGSNADQPLLLSVMGHVFDVTAGGKFYGPGKHYEIFTGRDASRAYVTGEFEKGGPGDTDEVDTLTPAQLLELDGWRAFYQKHASYKWVGRLSGYFFDDSGNPTASSASVYSQIAEGNLDAKVEEELKRIYPRCDSLWEVKQQSHWCTEKGHVPREMRTSPNGVATANAAKSSRCACVELSDTGVVASPVSAKDVKEEDLNALLQDALRRTEFVQYEGCDILAEKCITENTPS